MFSKAADPQLRYIPSNLSVFVARVSAVPSGYSEISTVAVNKPGRRLYNVRGPMLQESVSVLLQVDAADGNKIVTVRSPLQVCGRPPVAFSGDSVRIPPLL